MTGWIRKLLSAVLTVALIAACLPAAVLAEGESLPPEPALTEPTADPANVPASEPTPEIKPGDPAAAPTATAAVQPTATAPAEPTAAATAEPTALPTPEATTEPSAVPTPEATPEATSEATPEPTAEPAASATPEASETPSNENNSETSDAADPFDGEADSSATMEMPMMFAVSRTVEGINVDYPDDLVIKVTAEENRRHISLNPTSRWSLTKSENWLDDFSINWGQAGTYTIEFRVRQNTGAEREAIITLALDNGSDTVQIRVIQEKSEKLTDSALVNQDKEALKIGYAPGNSKSYVTKDLDLPQEGENGSMISWTSYNTSVIGHDGSVTRPEVDTQVTLIAGLNYNSTQVTKEFIVTVKGLSAPDEDENGSGEEGDEEEPPEAPYLTVATNSITISGHGGSEKIGISTNTAYDVIVTEACQSWLSASSGTLNGEHWVNISFDENLSGETRTGLIYVDTPDGKIENDITVIQPPLSAKIQVAREDWESDGAVLSPGDEITICWDIDIAALEDEVDSYTVTFTNSKTGETTTRTCEGTSCKYTCPESDGFYNVTVRVSANYSGNYIINSGSFVFGVGTGMDEPTEGGEGKPVVQLTVDADYFDAPINGAIGTCSIHSKLTALNGCKIIGYGTMQLCSWGWDPLSLQYCSSDYEVECLMTEGWGEGSGWALYGGDKYCAFVILEDGSYVYSNVWTAPGADLNESLFDDVYVSPSVYVKVGESFSLAGSISSSYPIHKIVVGLSDFDSGSSTNLGTMWTAGSSSAPLNVNSYNMANLGSFVAGSKLNGITIGPGSYWIDTYVYLNGDDADNAIYTGFALEIEEGEVEPATITGLKINPGSSVTVGDSISLAGTVNGNGSKINRISVAIRDADNPSAGGYAWTAGSVNNPLNASSYNLSSLGSFTTGSTLNGTVIGPGSYELQVYVNLEGTELDKDYILDLEIADVEPDPVKPTVTTVGHADVAPYSATVTGRITSAGDAEIDAWGFAYKSAGALDESIAWASGTPAAGVDCSVNLTNLKPGTKYSYRFFAEDSEGNKHFGAEKSFQFTLSAPALDCEKTINAAIGDEVTVRWNAADGADRYVVWFYDGDASTSVEVPAGAALEAAYTCNNAGTVYAEIYAIAGKTTNDLQSEPAKVIIVVKCVNHEWDPEKQSLIKDKGEWEAIGNQHQKVADYYKVTCKNCDETDIVKYEYTEEQKLATRADHKMGNPTYKYKNGSYHTKLGRICWVCNYQEPSSATEKHNFPGVFDSCTKCNFQPEFDVVQLTFDKNYTGPKPLVQHNFVDVYGECTIRLYTNLTSYEIKSSDSSVLRVIGKNEVQVVGRGEARIELWFNGRDVADIYLYSGIHETPKYNDGMDAYINNEIPDDGYQLAHQVIRNEEFDSLPYILSSVALQPLDFFIGLVTGNVTEGDYEESLIMILNNIPTDETREEYIAAQNVIYCDMLLEQIPDTPEYKTIRRAIENVRFRYANLVVDQVIENGGPAFNFGKDRVIDVVKAIFDDLTSENPRFSTKSILWVFEDVINGYVTPDPVDVMTYWHQKDIQERIDVTENYPVMMVFFSLIYDSKEASVDSSDLDGIENAYDMWRGAQIALNKMALTVADETLGDPVSIQLRKEIQQIQNMPLDEWEINSYYDKEFFVVPKVDIKNSELAKLTDGGNCFVSKWDELSTTEKQTVRTVCNGIKEFEKGSSSEMTMYIVSDGGSIVIETENGTQLWISQSTVGRDLEFGIKDREIDENRMKYPSFVTVEGNVVTLKDYVGKKDYVSGEITSTATINADALKVILSCPNYKEMLKCVEEMV